jgi:glycolate oxidase
VPVSELLASLRERYPAERLLTSPARLAPYESDALTSFRARPEAVVLARSRDEVVDLVRRCHAEGIPFVARGSGTSLSGGSLPVEGGIVIALNQLDRVLAIDPGERTAVVEPGAINASVSDAAAPHGLFYAPDPSSQSVCTIGGNLAFNSGGAHCLKHGMTSNHVLGVEAVLADGEIVRLGSGSPEPAGPGWLGLFVGSEGLFGIALEATLRLLPLPEATRTVLAAYDSLEAAGDAVAATIAAGILPVAMEIMDALAIEAAESSVSAGYPRAPALLIVELDGERDAVESDFSRLERVIRDSGASEVRVTQDPVERERIWKGRKGAFSAVGWLSPDYLVQDGCVPRTRLGETLGAIERLAAQHRLRVANVFHAGDGNLHPLILFDGREPGALDRAEGLAGEILNLCIEAGGSITGEHGVGMEKREHLARMFGPADLDVMRRLKASIDPAGIANRGKMFPPRTAARGGAGPGDASASSGPLPESASAGASPARTPPDNLPARPEVAALSEAFADARRSGARVLPRGAGTKPALSTPPNDVVALEVGGLRGVVEYDPAELTVTVLAGTPVAELAGALAEHGQHLPFDPPLAAAGATIGGTIAAGISGPGRLRHGGARDFVIGVRFLDGRGVLVAGGGRVVKNAAGFDLPKLLTGSLGRLGVIVELTLKVLPAPEEWASLRLEMGDLDSALDAVARLARSSLELEALDLEPPGALQIRLGGPAGSLDPRLRRVEALVGTGGEHVRGAAEEERWSAARELAWAPADASVAKVATRPGALPDLDGALERAGAHRRYSSAGCIAWVAWPSAVSPEHLDATLAELALGAVRLTGPPGPVLLGGEEGGAFAARARRGLDPDGAFVNP